MRDVPLGEASFVQKTPTGYASEFMDPHGIYYDARGAMLDVNDFPGPLSGVAVIGHGQQKTKPERTTGNSQDALLPCMRLLVFA